MTASPAIPSPPRVPGRILRWTGIAVVWLLLLEAAAWITLTLRPEWNRPLVPWKQADCLSGEAWVDDYFDEWWRSYRVRWHPYVYWRREPFSGRHIHVDADGIRRTWTAKPPTGDAPSVLAFGGSTLWGFGARDDHSIPSQLSRRLAEAGVPCRVTNYGETGYVSTQETIALARALQEGARPAAVVFYDGANDVFAAFQSGQAGIPQNEYRRAKEFNLLQTRGEKTLMLLAGALYHAAQQTGTARVAEALRERAAAGRPWAAGHAAAASELAGQVVDAYLANVRAVRSLADEYGFQAFFYWQPVIFDRMELTAFERKQADQAAALGPLFRAAAAELEARRAAGDEAALAVRDLSRVLDAVDGPLFMDFCHVSEKANGKVADRIAADVRQALH